MKKRNHVYRLFVLLSILAIVSVIMTGCSSTKGDLNKENSAIFNEPQRIISLMPSHTETLFALGLSDKVVAVTKYDNYPTDVKDKVEYVFEDGINPNVEQIVKLNPDLVVLGAHSRQLIDKLKSLGLNVVNYDPQSIKESYETIKAIGKVTNKESEAIELVNKMNEKEQMIVNKVTQIEESDKVHVWVEVSPELFTPGQGTFMNELITEAGGINIVDEQGWVQFNEEKIIKKNPQVILTTYGYYDKNATANILAREGWQNVSAVKQKRIVDLNSELVTRPGPRIIDGLELISKSLYPELFK